MAGRIAYYGGIVKDGLVLDLDAAKQDSYPKSGTTWRDISGNGYTGTLTNGPIFNSSNGGSIVFDGVDDYIDNIGTVNDFNFIFSVGTFSISFWIQKPINNARYALVGNTLTNTEKGWFIIAEYGVSGFGNNCLRFNAAGAAVNTGLIAGSTDDNTLGTSWTHCVFTCQNPDKIGQWYINGLSSTTSKRVGSGGANQGDYYTGPATRTINLGRCNYSSTVIPLNGNIAQTLLYNRALTAQEILQNYNATKTRFQ
jgi:hypothetical protein